MQNRLYIVRALAIFVMAFFSVSCSTKVNKYFYAEFTSDNDNPYTQGEITATNDSLAFIAAYEKFFISEAVYMKMIRMNPSSIDYLDKPFRFSLHNADGEGIYLNIPRKDLSSIYEDIVKEVLGTTDIESYFIEERKAFAGAEFGMSIKQVSEIPSFKNYRVYERQINGVRIPIGEDTYDVFLLFEANDELFSVLFTTMIFSDANHLNTSIKHRVENFKEIIQETYGSPANDYGYPSILSLEQGRIKWVYVWNLGRKTIQIGVEESSSGSRYRMYGKISDSIREHANRTQREKSIIETSALF